MDFSLSQEHLMARDLFKSFAQNEVKPLAQEVDEEERFPAETVEKMGKLGFMGIPIPREYGGQGCDYLTYVMCIEEIAKVCGTTAVILCGHSGLCEIPLLEYIFGSISTSVRDTELVIVAQCEWDSPRDRPELKNTSIKEML